MRITNNMMSNNLNLNINRNMRNLDDTGHQLATGIRVHRPSDDPIAAARILRFRSNLSRNEQYLENVNQANDWMTTTEGAIAEIERLIGGDAGIMRLLQSGSSTDNNLDQMRMMTVQLAQLVSQMGTVMNTEFGGRFIFSGFRTDTPPIFQTDRPNDSFNITQEFGSGDVQTGTSVVNSGMENGGFRTYETDTIRLPYRGSQNVTVIIRNPDGTTTPFPTPPEMELRVVNTNDPDSFTPGDDEIIFNPETGQLIFGSNVAEQVRVSDGISVNYNQHGFRRGEPNPAVFFNSRNLNTGRTYTMNNQSMEQVFGLSTTMAINTLGKDIFSATMFAELTGLIQFMTDLENNGLTSEAEVRSYFEAYALSYDPPLDQEIIDQMVSEFMRDEENKATVAAQRKFSNTLGAMEGHNRNIQRERADLGARMARLDSKTERLENDIMMYEDIIYRNEAADVARLGVEMQALLAVFQASLLVSGNVLRLSLADFI